MSIRHTKHKQAKNLKKAPTTMAGPSLSNTKRWRCVSPSVRLNGFTILTLLVVLILSSSDGVLGWVQPRRPITITHRKNCLMAAHRHPSSELSSSPTKVSSNVQLRRYTHDGFQLTYRYQPAAATTTTIKDSAKKNADRSNSIVFLLIHPVGIGLSSWFWENMMQACLQDGEQESQQWEVDLYAPDLIGCGIANGSDTWDPDQRGLFFPLDWVRGCETLLQEITSKSGSSSNLASSTSPRQCIVITQGGLAPVGVILAARNPTLVSKLVLSSPPTWKDMTTAVPSDELQRNYDFLRSRSWGNLAFQLLETKWAIEFFSNTFLFGNQQCDQRWLNYAVSELSPLARPPVQVFNAGFLNHRSFYEELATLSQPTLVLSGERDEQRRIRREPYRTYMKDCQLETLVGKNVLAWESPREFVHAIQKFVT